MWLKVQPQAAAPLKSGPRPKSISSSARRVFLNPYLSSSIAICWVVGRRRPTSRGLQVKRLKMLRLKDQGFWDRIFGASCEQETGMASEVWHQYRGVPRDSCSGQADLSTSSSDGPSHRQSFALSISPRGRAEQHLEPSGDLTMPGAGLQPSSPDTFPLALRCSALLPDFRQRFFKRPSTT